MGRVGILTFHRALNFGAVLQCYALQKSISKAGVDCEVIDYRCKFIEDYYVPLWKKFFKSPKRFIASFIFNSDALKSRKVFDGFLNQYVNLSSQQFDSIADLEKITDDFDLFVTGSDQVWNPYCAGFDKAYFLNFVEASRKKVAYAASFGLTELPIEFKDMYRNLLSNFAKISVREEHGKWILDDLSISGARLVQDPTLLITKEDWSVICPSQQLYEDNFILLYLIVEDESIIKFARDLSNATGLRVLYVNDRIFNISGFVNLRNIGVADWVGYFEQATYVVTNSFHGVAFSINMNKQFFYGLLPGNAKVNSRIENIISEFDLSERNFTSSKSVTSIDFNSINLHLESLRRESIGFLEEVLLVGDL